MLSQAARRAKADPAGLAVSHEHQISPGMSRLGYTFSLDVD